MTRRVVVVLLLAALLALAVPGVALAGGPLDFLGRVLEGIGKAASEVLEVPRGAVRGATRWMGPVIGPLAQAYLGGQLMGAGRVGDVLQGALAAEAAGQTAANQREAVEALRDSYLDQAWQHYQAADYLAQQVEMIKASAVAGDVHGLINIRLLQNGHEKLAEYYSSQADHVDYDDVVRLTGNQLLLSVVNGTKNVVLNEFTEEIRQVIAIQAIRNCVREDRNAGNPLEQLWTAYAVAEIAKYGIERPAQDMVDRVKDSVRNYWETAGEDVKQNWHEFVAGVVADEVEKLEQQEGGSELLGEIFEGTIRVDLLEYSPEATLPGAHMVISVGEDRSVTGSYERIIQGTDAAGEYRLTQTGSFTGSINDTNRIVASGTFHSVSLIQGKTSTNDYPLTVRASPTSEDLNTWEVIAQVEDQPETVFTGHVP